MTYINAGLNSASDCVHGEEEEEEEEEIDR